MRYSEPTNEVGLRFIRNCKGDMPNFSLKTLLKCVAFSKPLSNEISFTGNNLSDGIYLLQTVSGGITETKKIVVVNE